MKLEDLRDDDDDEDFESADLENITRLLRERPRRYVDLIALTGVSHRTLKLRIAVLRKTQPGMRERRDGPSLIMWVEDLENPPPPVVTACPRHTALTGCPHCDGDGFRRIPRDVWEARRAERERVRRETYLREENRDRTITTAASRKSEGPAR